MFAVKEGGIMRDDHNENSVAATGIGAVLAGVLSMFARSADDVARRDRI